MAISNSLDMRDFMSEAKFYEGYSRYIDEEDRYESWDESVDRVMAMHKGYYKDNFTFIHFCTNTNHLFFFSYINRIFSFS